MTDVENDLIDPETQAPVLTRMRAKIRLDAVDLSTKDKDHAKAEAKMAADPSRSVPIGAMGSGSDYGVFVEHLGIPSLDFRYDDEGKAAGVYHSRYDTFEHHSRFVDPGFVYDTLLARTVGRAVLRVADADLPVERASDFASQMVQDLSELKKLAQDSREKQELQAGLLRDRVFELTADPTIPSGNPTALKEVPKFDFAPLEFAVKRLTESAKAYDDALTRNGASLSPDRLARLQELMNTIEATLTSDTGLPGRPWYRNLIYAPGTLTGYGTKTMPGVREGIEQERFDDATRYITLTAGVLNAYSDRLDQATAVLNGG